MAKAKATKRKRGRPKTTGAGAQIQVRCHADLLAAIDQWRTEQEFEVSRPDAIRRLTEAGLKAAGYLM